MAGGHAWQGMCMVGGVHSGGMHGRGHAWQGMCMVGWSCVVGACMAEGMHGRGHACHACPP